MYHIAYDGRNGSTVYSAVNYMIWGAEIHISTTWVRPGRPPRRRLSSRTGTERRSTRFGTSSRAGPANPMCFMQVRIPPRCSLSDDGGMNWQEIRSVADHPTSKHWFPGMGGLCLYSMALDELNPARMWVGISAAGVYGTSDGGESWKPLNKGVRADFIPDEVDLEFGQCPHKLPGHPQKDGLLYQQNHCGTYRSDDGGKVWIDITDGLPSRFGLALGLHPHDPNTLYVLPEDNAIADDEVGGEFRIVSGNKFRVFRSSNGGSDWDTLTNGLPQRNAYLHSMREGMATDNLDPCGVYVGTTNGQIFYSRDEGYNWELLIDNLPPINSVEVAQF